MSRCCCGNGKEENGDSSCCTPAGRVDWLLWGSLTVVFAACIAHVFFAPALAVGPASLAAFAAGIFALASKAWWGILAGIVAVAVIGRLPRELVAGLLGRGGTFSGILRATFAGTLLDLCNHGILLVGMQLYQKGASLGQTLAFLMAGAATDYTEILALRETTRSWKATLALPLISTPQVLVIGWILNHFH